ncbi:MAG: glycine zipper domain-containing protein [Planctomycetaceae bacterium]
MIRYLIPALIAVALPLDTASAQVNTQRGSVLGGLAGAAAGAAIGEHNDKPLAGALIGGAVGLVTGATLGNARDRQVADQRAYAYQQQQFQRQQLNQQLAKSVTPHDVITMTRSGLSETVIINHIQANGVRQELQIADVITLHDNGVSERVISAMQHSRIGPATAAAPVAAPVQVYQAAPPIVVEQYVTPRYFYSPPRHYYGPRYPSHGIHFSHHHHR